MPLVASLRARKAPHSAAPIAPASTLCSCVRKSSGFSFSSAASRRVCTRPTSAESPPVTSTTPWALAALSSRTKRPAIDWWMPLMMLGAEIPRETMLITSVSASTAQMDEHCSGSSASSERGPISSRVIPR